MQELVPGGEIVLRLSRSACLSVVGAFLSNSYIESNIGSRKLEPYNQSFFFQIINPARTHLLQRPETLRACGFSSGLEITPLSRLPIAIRIA